MPPIFTVGRGPAGHGAAHGMEGVGRTGQCQSQDITAQEEFIAGDEPVGFGGRAALMPKGDNRSTAAALFESA